LLLTAQQYKNKENKMKHFNPETKTFKLFNAMYNGEAVTASAAEKRFGIKNISAEVSRIRQNGYAVYANSRVAGNNVKVTEYVIGKPSRAIVAAGYKAMAAGLV
jgi:hypothetical protein